MNRTPPNRQVLFDLRENTSTEVIKKGPPQAINTPDTSIATVEKLLIAAGLASTRNQSQAIVRNFRVLNGQTLKPEQCEQLCRLLRSIRGVFGS